MKVIFLDVDGVLNSKKSMLRNYYAGVHVRGIGEDRTDWPDTIMVERVNNIIKETDAEIVLSSAWRHVGINKMQEYFRAWGICKSIIDFTPKLYVKRGIEILQWLSNESGKSAEQCCIIDDDSDMLNLMPLLIKTNYIVGIQDIDVEKAITLLNQVEIWNEIIPNLHQMSMSGDSII